MQINTKFLLLFFLYVANNVEAQKISLQSQTANIESKAILQDHHLYTYPSKLQKEQRFKERFRSIATCFALVSSNAQNMNLQFVNESGTFEINEALNLNNTVWAGSIGSGFEYDIYQNLFFSTIIFQGIGEFDYGSIQLGLGYKWQLNNNEEKPLRLVLALDYVYSTLLQKIKDYDNTDQVKIAGKSFKKDNIKAELFSRRNALLPKVRLEFKIARRWDIFTDLGYFIPVSKRQDGLFFTDGKRSSWVRQIGQQRAKIDLSNPNLFLRTNNVNTDKLALQTNLFISLGFKRNFK